MEVKRWTLYLHPLFQQQLEKLAAQVEALQAEAPSDERNLTQTPAFCKAAALLPAHWGLHQRMQIHNFYLCDSEPEHAVPVVSPDANRKL